MTNQVKLTNVEKWKIKEREAYEKTLDLIVTNQVDAVKKIIETMKLCDIDEKEVAGLKLQTQLAQFLLETRGHNNKGPQTVKNTQINYNLSSDFSDEERLRFLEEVKLASGGDD